MDARVEITPSAKGALIVALLILAACSGGGGAPSVPSQPSQVQNPVQAPATPSAVSNIKIYATAGNTILVYDENGHPFAVACDFPGLMNPFQIAFDSHNQRLYVTGSVGPPNFHIPILAFDLSGNPTKTTGTFPSAGLVITFDSHNNHLYTFSFGEPAASVFDEEGNPVTVSGTFPDVNQPSAAAFDPFNNQIYVANTTGKQITVYDEQGHELPFPEVLIPCPDSTALVFDPNNRHFFLGNAMGATCSPAILVFDQSGNVITPTGSFPNAESTQGMAFDKHSSRLYVENFGGGAVLVYDEQGNQIKTSGSFPGADGSGLVAAPQ